MIKVITEPKIEKLLHKVVVDAIFLHKRVYDNKISVAEYVRELDNLKKGVEGEIREVMLREIEEVAVR
jgi:hypothetical protein